MLDGGGSSPQSVARKLRLVDGLAPLADQAAGNTATASAVVSTCSSKLSICGSKASSRWARAVGCGSKRRSCAEWLAERAVEGAAVARRVHRVQRPLLQVADATTPAQSFAAAQLASRIERGLAPLAALAEKSMLSGRATPAARSGRWCSRPSSSRRRRSNTPQEFPAWCRPVKAKASGCSKGKDCKWKHQK